MTSFAARRNSHRCPTHPGALLREDTLPAIGKSNTEIADLLGISRQQFYGILREDRAVSAAVSVCFGKMFGNEPLMWIRMQAAYDVWHAAREIDVSRIPTLSGGYCVDTTLRTCAPKESSTPA
jgi:addiction module HigA family antidote